MKKRIYKKPRLQIDNSQPCEKIAASQSDSSLFFEMPDDWNSIEQGEGYEEFH